MCSPPGEREQENRLGLDAQLNKVCDAEGDCAGLSGACARDDEMRAIHRAHCCILCRVELVPVVDAELLGCLGGDDIGVRLLESVFLDVGHT